MPRTYHDPRGDQIALVQHKAQMLVRLLALEVGLDVAAARAHWVAGIQHLLGERLWWARPSIDAVMMRKKGGIDGDRKRQRETEGRRERSVYVCYGSCGK